MNRRDDKDRRVQVRMSKSDFFARRADSRRFAVGFFSCVYTQQPPSRIGFAAIQPNKSLICGYRLVISHAPTLNRAHPELDSRLVTAHPSALTHTRKSKLMAQFFFSASRIISPYSGCSSRSWRFETIHPGISPISYLVLLETYPSDAS